MIGEVLAGLLLGPSLLGPEFSGWILPSLAEAVEELTSTAEELHAVNVELTEAQRVAHASQQRYQELFDGVPEAYLVTDLQGPAGWPHVWRIHDGRDVSSQDAHERTPAALGA